MTGPEEAAKQLKLWISQASPEFNPRSTFRFDTTAAYDLRDIKATPGRIVARMRITPRYQNNYGTMHGGLMTVLIDVVGSAAVLTKTDADGVSLNISCDYLSPMPGGEDVEIDARVLKVGRRVATVKVDFRRVRTGEVVACGKLIEVLPLPKPPSRTSTKRVATSEQGVDDGRASSDVPQSRL